MEGGKINNSCDRLIPAGSIIADDGKWVDVPGEIMG
jgi:hypothetical protein